MSNTTKTVAIIGAGKLGITLAQLALKAGYIVYIAGSGPAQKIKLSVEIIAPGARAEKASNAIKHADVVILALPLSKYKTLNPIDLNGKLIIDAMNYWWEVDGENETLKNPITSTSQLVQEYLPQSRVVKALSHMGYHHLLDESRPVGSSNRKAIAVAADNQLDAQIASELIHNLGFDPVHIGPLSAGRQLEPGHALFGANISATELKKSISKN